MKDDEMMSKGVGALLRSMRKHNRRTVIQPAKLNIRNKNFNCIVYDISLGGIRLKTEAKVVAGDDVYVQIKDKLKQVAQVIWCSGEFMGLSFVDDPEMVKAGLGNLASGLS
ncbi:MAG: PilZ domain-containing protein [Emcibacter sp.]|nr:PilZ domain-containing protein [Emcibacter sp.]